MGKNPNVNYMDYESRQTSVVEITLVVRRQSPGDNQ